LFSRAASHKCLPWVPLSLSLSRSCVLCLGGSMASVLVMPAAASVGSVAHNVIAAARAQKEPGMTSSDAVSSMTLFSRAASHKCLPWKSAFCPRLVPVPLFSGSSNFRAERRRGLAVVSKVSETETKTKISEAAEATESSEELQETLNSALKSVQEAVSFFFFFFPSSDWQGSFGHVHVFPHNTSM
jgi:hypothetical protein